jgi:hypothetical protein
MYVLTVCCFILLLGELKQEEETQTMASRFTKAFQLIALALVFSVAQLYVVAVPTRTNTDPRKDKSTVTQPKAETVTNESVDLTAAAANTLSENQLPTAQAASERMPLTAGTKTILNRIFSKGNVEARIAAGNTFLSTGTKASFANATFKTSPKRAARALPDDDGDDDGNSSRGAWIAVGVIAAVLTIAIIGLRADRNRGDGN